MLLETVSVALPSSDSAKLPTPMAPPQPVFSSLNLPFSKTHESACREPPPRKMRAPSPDLDDNRPSLIVSPDKDRLPSTLKTRPFPNAVMVASVSENITTDALASICISDEIPMCPVTLTETPSAIAAFNASSESASTEYDPALSSIAKLSLRIAWCLRRCCCIITVAR